MVDPKFHDLIDLLCCGLDPSLDEPEYLSAPVRPGSQGRALENQSYLPASANQNCPNATEPSLCLDGGLSHYL